MKKVATIGFFDGVHRGHQYLCQQLKQLAATVSGSSAAGESAATVSGSSAAGDAASTLVLTFNEHPQRVLGRPNAPKLLTTNPEKSYFLECVCGIDEVVFLDFTAEMAALSARDFMEQYLRDRYGVTHLLIGYDHHFGRPQRDAEGRRIPEGFEDYQRYGRELGIEVLLAKELPHISPVGETEEAVFPPVGGTEGGRHVSSSAIRSLIANGDVETANRFLGYTFRINGTVVSGHQVGRTIGFPTVNLRPTSDAMLLPAPGVYVTMVRVYGRDFPAVTNIGHRPTLNNGPELSVESHFLGVEKLPPFADCPISIDLHTRLRSEQRFDSIDALKEQIARDIDEAIAWHREHVQNVY